MRLEEEIALFAIELGKGPERVQAGFVRTRLLAMLKFPHEDTAMDQDRDLNDPLGLWGAAPGWRCWVGRHGECEPLGADESCTCTCGVGGHGHDSTGVPTEGCDCGHEGMGERWHAQDCVWRSTWHQRMHQAAQDVTGENG